MKKSAILACDWNAEQQAGNEPVTQAIARAAFEHSAEGLVVPSARHASGVNLVYYPTHRRDGTVIQTLDEAQKPERLEESLSRKLVREVANASPDVNVLCEAYRLKREELGRLTGFSLRALAGWSAGQLPSQPAMRRLHEVRRLLDALAEIVKEESIPRWLHQPNPAFDRLTPLQVIELGEIDRIWAMVHDLGSGQPE